MRRLTSSRRCAAIALLAIATGCALPRGGHGVQPARNESASAVEKISSGGRLKEAAGAGETPAPQVLLVSHPSPVEPAPIETQATIPEPIAESPQPVYTSDDPSDPFNGLAELSVEQLVAEVQARNPSLQAASAAWRAATERYPQVVSLDDPDVQFP